MGWGHHQGPVQYRHQVCIRQVTLDDSVNEDCLYWKQEVSGIYSVRSAYRLLQTHKNLWRREDDNNMWRQVWRIKAPLKTLNLLWRALSHCLPTLSQLWNKYVPVVDVCPICSLHNETIDHALVTFPFVSQCWQTGLPNIILNAASYFSDWLLHNFQKSTRGMCSSNHPLLDYLEGPKWFCMESKACSSKCNCCLS